MAFCYTTTRSVLCSQISPALVPNWCIIAPLSLPTKSHLLVDTKKSSNSNFFFYFETPFIIKLFVQYHKKIDKEIRAKLSSKKPNCKGSPFSKIAPRFLLQIFSASVLLVYAKTFIQLDLLLFTLVLYLLCYYIFEQNRFYSLLVQTYLLCCIICIPYVFCVSTIYYVFRYATISRHAKQFCVQNSRAMYLPNGKVLVHGKGMNVIMCPFMKTRMCSF